MSTFTEMLLNGTSMIPEDITALLLSMEGPVTDDLALEGRRPSFELREVIMEGFGPHGGPNKLELSEGLTVVMGKNGTGKTHILLAVNWCIFGNRGSQDPWISQMDPFGSDLVNWDRDLEHGDHVKVTSVFRWNGDLYRIERKMDRNGQKVRVEKKSSGKWVEHTGIPAGLDPDILPFLLFQGEAVMFLSSEGHFTGRGSLGTAVMAISGASRSENGLNQVIRSKELIIERLEKNLDRGLPLEREMGRMDGKFELLEREEKEVRRNIRELEKGKSSSIEEYRTALKELSRMGTVTREQENIIRLKARLPSFRKEIGSLLSGASREILRSTAKRALAGALDEKEERTRKRILCGAYDAQVSIVEKILGSRQCICGTSIGRSGMGRERLDSLMSRLDAKREKVSDRGADIPWTSDNVMETSRMILAKEPFTRDDLKRSMRRVIRAEKLLKASIPKERSTPDPLIDSIRTYERMSIELERRQKELEKLRSRMSRLRSDISVKRTELVKIWGKGKDSTGFKDSLDRADLLIRSLRSSVDRTLNSFLEELEKEVNSLIKEMDRGDWISEFKVHRESWTIGIVRKGEDHERTVTLPFLSAGEREAVATLVVISMSRMTGSSLVLDSPFPYMDRSFRRNIFRMLPLLSGRVLITIPTGTIDPAEFKEVIEDWRSAGRETVVYSLEKVSGGSVMGRDEGGFLG